MIQTITSPFKREIQHPCATEAKAKHTLRIIKQCQWWLRAPCPVAGGTGPSSHGARVLIATCIVMRHILSISTDGRRFPIWLAFSFQTYASSPSAVNNRKLSGFWALLHSQKVPYFRRNPPWSILWSLPPWSDYQRKRGCGQQLRPRALYDWEGTDRHCVRAH